MRMVGAVDIHRSQITYKLQDNGTGAVRRGRIACERESVRSWLAGLRGPDLHIALEATTGWRFVAEEIERAGFTAHLAEPAETAAARGPKRRAKTDKADCDNMVNLLTAGRLPESWKPPEHMLEIRTLVRLRKDLIDERREWQQRIQAQLFHQGIPRGMRRLRTADGRAQLAAIDLSGAGRELVATGLSVMDHLDERLDPIDAQLISFAKRQPGCIAVDRLYGVGAVTAVAIWAELGDCRRFSNSDDAVRYAGLDITVYESDGKRAPGHLSRQGPAVLRWALYEAAQCAARKTSPDYGYYVATKKRIDHNRACLAVARKLCRRAYHILKELGDAALQPVSTTAPAPRQRVRVAA